MWQGSCFRHSIYFYGFSWTEHTARGARSSLGFSIHLILAQTDQVLLILDFALSKMISGKRESVG